MTPVDLTSWGELIGMDSSKVLDADQAIASAGFVNINRLSFPLLSGKLYRFEAFLVFQASVTSVGALFGLNGPANPTTLIAKSSRQITVGGTPLAGMFQDSVLTAYDTPLPNSLGEIAATTNLLHIMEGIIVPSAAGTFAVRASKENVAGTVTVKQGSWLKYQQMAA